MKRDLYQKLLNWKKSLQRKPLVLRGARQVGKTYLLNEFGSNEFQSYLYINFEEKPEFKVFFEKNLDPQRIIKDLSLYLDQEISPHKTLLIFDEIQECPSALTSLKYFNEKANDYFIIAAGSLLGVKLSKNKGFPVGKVNFLDLYPLTFFEFLTAMGKDSLRRFLQEIATIEPISEPLHSQLVELLRIYTLLGGMPEVVKKYLETDNLIAARAIQIEVLKAYLLDFAKHAPSNEIMKITTVWESIPSQLAKENKKFIFTAMKASARGREYETAIQWLADAGLIYKSYNVSIPHLPLNSYADKNIFKVFLMDVGLLGAMSELPPKAVLEGDKLFTEFKGSLTENLVAQELKAVQQTGLYYWTSSGQAEVDFLITLEGKIFPLEVKAGNIGKQKSLRVYDQKYHPDYLLRTSLMNLNRDGIINYPLYLIGHLLVPNANGVKS